VASVQRLSSRDLLGSNAEVARSMGHRGATHRTSPVDVVAGLSRLCSNTADSIKRVEGGVIVTATDELLQNNADYAEGFDKADLPLPPAKGVAVVACMDARLNVYGMLGLREGDAHVIRNAGGVITDDEIRSLAISQRLLGTREIILIHHTDCGMLTFTDDELKQQIQEEAGIKPHFSMESFTDLEEDVRQSISRIQASPFIPHKDAVRGFVYEVETGRLREVS
jgi:carbonic anhydrase